MADKHKYNTSNKKRGVALVINNGKFDSAPKIDGYQVDGKNVKETFEALQFEVRMFQDVKADAMRDRIREVSRGDHTDRDCFACVIMSHGREDQVWATDGPVDLEDVFQPFKREKCSLLGKPKLFFIEACRGEKLDDGAALGVEGDGPGDKIQRIPLEADFLVAYSTAGGFSAWQNKQAGSWFIQSLCSVLKEHGRSLDVMTMMTRVNREVAFEFETRSRDPKYHGKKQIPCITSMLTKDLFFVTKP